MARIFLDQNETFTVGGSDDTLLGQAGGDPGEGVLVQEGVTGLETNAAIERLDLPRALSAYSFQVTDNGLEISANGNTIVTIPSLNQTLELRTADGSINLSQSGAQEFTATSPADGSTATIGTSPSTPSIPLGAETAETAPATNTVGVSDNGPVAEGGTASFTVDLSQQADEAVTVDYATGLVGGASADDRGTPTIDGNDANLTGTLTFAAGETSRTIDIPVKEDAIGPEDSEGVNVSLFNLSGPDQVTLANASTTARINQAPMSFSLSLVDEEVQEGQTATYKVEASAPVEADTDVSFNVVAGDPNAADQGTKNTNLNDFRPGAFNPSTTTIQAGSTTTTFDVRPRYEGLTELPEDFVVEATIEGKTQSVTTRLLSHIRDVLFSLTTNADTFQPNAVNEANQPTSLPEPFRGTSDNQFQGSDVIKASDGDDEVHAREFANGTNDTIAPVLNSVETVRIDVRDETDDANDVLTFDATDATGLEDVNIQELNQGSDTSDLATATVDNVDQDVVVTFKDATDADSGSEGIVNVNNTSGDGDAATIGLYESKLDESGGASGGLIVDGIEDLTIDVTGDSGSTIDELKADNATTLTVVGDQGLTIGDALSNNASNIETINASTSVDVTTGAIGQNLSADTGAGNDTIDATAMTSNLTATTGAGDDTITGTRFADNITIGDGSDTVVHDANAFGASDNITDFSSGNDRIFIDLTMGNGPMTDDNTIESAAGGPANGNATLAVFTTGTGSNTIGGTAFLANSATGTATALSSSAQLFTASSFSALQSAITSVAASRASNTGDAGNAAFGFGTGASQLFIFSFTDSQPGASNGAGELSTVTRTVATLGNGSVAFDDIAIF